MVLKCTPKQKGKPEFDVVVPIEPPLSGYEAVKPRLLEMKALAQEGLGMIKAPKITTFSPPSRIMYTAVTGVYVAFATFAHFAPRSAPPGSLIETVSTPIYLLRGVLGERALAIQFGTLVVAHILESLYTFSLCRKHSTGFLVGVSACPFIRS